MLHSLISAEKKFGGQVHFKVWHFGLNVRCFPGFEDPLIQSNNGEQSYQDDDDYDYDYNDDDDDDDDDD